MRRLPPEVFDDDSNVPNCKLNTYELNISMVQNALACRSKLKFHRHIFRLFCLLKSGTIPAECGLHMR